MAADERTEEAEEIEPPGAGATVTGIGRAAGTEEAADAGPRGFFRSYTLITGTAAAVVVEVLILFGLRPLRLWIPVLVFLAGGGAVLALFDRVEPQPEHQVRWMTFAALAVSIASLLVATVTLVGGYTFPG